MKKKVFATLLAVSMIASMVPAAVSVQAADGDSIRLVNGKIEVDAQLKKLDEMYEKETLEYIRLLGLVNCRLAQMASQVVEVVYGIPVTQATLTMSK